MAVATQLSLYNEALRLLGERRLASLSESVQSRRTLDDVWNDGAIDFCLEQGMWNFAMRAVEITKSTVTIPQFGYTNAFDKPNDHIVTAGVAVDEFFNLPLLRVQEEVDFWFADEETIYVRYVSNAATYGNDFSKWPETFRKYVAAFLAAETALTITSSESKQKTAIAIMQARLKDARSKDAMAEATAFTPQGGWTAARRGGSRGDRGSRSQLIG